MTRLVITLADDGRFNIEGPLDNKMVCYGMLGLAHEAILKRQPSTGIVMPTGPVPVPPPSKS